MQGLIHSPWTLTWTSRMFLYLRLHIEARLLGKAGSHCEPQNVRLGRDLRNQLSLASTFLYEYLDSRNPSHSFRLEEQDGGPSWRGRGPTLNISRLGPMTFEVNEL